MTNVWKLTQRQQSIDLYLQACANLYGHITPRRFLLIYNKYNEDKLLKDELLQYSNKLNRQANNYCIYTNAIINSTVAPKSLTEQYITKAIKSITFPKRKNC